MSTRDAIPPDSTCWTVIRGAAEGRNGDRDDFVRRYSRVVRAYLESRWRDSPHWQEIDDALQEVFLECFRQGGVLDNVTRDRPNAFRAFLFGVTHNVARRFESRAALARENPAGSAVDLNRARESEESLSQAFDRAWARALLKEALHFQQREAESKGERALRRIELLRLRFEEKMPIRDIASRWQADPALIHRDYLIARKEFRAALVAVLGFHHPGSAAQAEQELASLRSLLP